MAIGAIEALQSFGYNKGNGSKMIPIVSVDGVPEAIDLVDKGIMTNTVIQDAKFATEAMFLCGMNLVNNKKPLEGTNYKFDATGIAVHVPFRIY